MIERWCPLGRGCLPTRRVCHLDDFARGAAEAVSSLLSSRHRISFDAARLPDPLPDVASQDRRHRRSSAREPSDHVVENSQRVMPRGLWSSRLLGAAAEYSLMNVLRFSHPPTGHPNHDVS